MVNEDIQSKPSPVVMVQFSEVGSTLFNLHIDKDVTPLQLLAVGEYLKLLAREDLLAHLNRVQQQAEANRIVTPDNPMDGGIMDISKS